MREKRSKCGKRRANAQAGGPVFACSRCDAKMAQRSSVDVCVPVPAPLTYVANVC
jgi:hypothetical protein